MQRKTPYKYRINSDWQFRWASSPAGHAQRYVYRYKVNSYRTGRAVYLWSFYNPVGDEPSPISSVGPLGETLPSFGRASYSP
jgi:hypothetical protein